jgi:hypothetical protein
MDQLMARPDFLTNLAQSAGAMSTLVNHMLDPSVSDWSTATVSGKTLLTPQEQVQFKEMLDPYVPHIRAFFKGEPLPHSTEQHGGAEELIKKVQQQLTKNITYMGQHNVVMYGGTQVDVLREREQQANRDPKGDITVYTGPPPVNLPLRFITTSIVTLLDVIRMLISLVGWERGAEILSVVVSAMEVARGEWKRGITSFMGYFGTKSLWIGQVFKVFVYIFQTIPTAMNHVMLDDVTELGRSIVFGMALNIFQTVAPANIRQVFIKNIDIINKNNELLTEFFSDASRQRQYNYTFDPTNPRYAIYFNQYSWGDLTEFQSYMIEAKCTEKMVAFHKKLAEELKKEEVKEKAILASKMATDQHSKALPITGVDITKALLGVMGLLPAPNCETDKKTLVDHVIKLVIDPPEAAKSSLSADLTALLATVPDIATYALPPGPLVNMPNVSRFTGLMSSAFDAVQKKAQNAAQAVSGKVDTLMPKKPQWKVKLEQLQEQVKNMDEHLASIDQIKELEAQVQKTQQQINEKEKSSSTGQPTGSALSPSAFVFPASAPPSALPSAQPLQAKPFPPSRKGGRHTRRTRRIRASTRSPRQRARE